MGSDIRSTKIAKVFKFFDKDDSKFIDKNDFKLSAHYAATQRGWVPGDAKHKDIEDSMLKVWNSLQKHADKDNDGEVSFDEWVAMWDEFANNPTSPLEWQSLYCKHIFDFQDAGGDGVVDVDEFCAVTQSFGLDKDKAIRSFEILSKGKSSINWEEFKELWKDFFLSNDPNAPGNYMFGPL